MSTAGVPTPGRDGAGFGHEGKLVIVTGGANGIGRSVCLEFARCGANVLCADFDDDAGAETVAEASGLAGSVKFMHADMTDATVPAQIVAAAQDWQNGAPVGCLVNNVGIQEDNGTPVHLLEEAVWDKVMDVNIKSYFLMAKYALPSMIEEQSGVIINMASVQGHQSQVGIPAYASSKGAILSLTRQMAMDYSNSGIRSVSVSPGTILTPLVDFVITSDPVQFPEGIAGLDKGYPRGSIGAPEDIANLCLFLASPYAANITGQDICCDGGIMAMGGWNDNIGYKSYTK